MTEPASTNVPASNPIAKHPKPIHWYARRYVERFGFHLVPIEPKRKFPRKSDWGNHCLTTPDAAEAYYRKHPDWNMGIALGPSRMCSLDIDCASSWAIICAEYGIPEDALAGFPTINARGTRVMFRVPEGVHLPYVKLTWPSRNDPTGDKHRAAIAAAAGAKAAGDTSREARIRAVARRWARYTVLELRASCDGEQRQDVVPPSVHPTTGEPYRWSVQPTEEWPTPPVWLLAIWRDWDRFKPQLTGMCPWLPEDKQPVRKLEKQAKRSHKIRGSVIDAFNDAHDLETVLERYGYQRMGVARYLSPHSGTQLPGVVLFRDRAACWIHHASDPLCSEESGKPVNAFDLYCYYEHHGDLHKSVKAAARLMGMESAPDILAPSSQPPTPAPDSPALSTPMGGPDYSGMLPYAGQNGKPVRHIGNLAEICRRLGVMLRYNTIKKREEILIPGAAFSLDNEANASLAWLMSECSLFNFPTDKLSDFITFLADRNPYNPVQAWIDSRLWDGTPRLQALCDTITVIGDQSIKETLIRRWMISAVAAAYSSDGISSPGVLTLQGPQYLGKTKWFKSLVPADLDLIQDGMILKPDDKDSVKQCTSYWLVELGELDSTFRKADIAQLKAFITRQIDVLRQPYARRESRFPRRTVFFASVNPREFLHDPTGNRRFWTIECQSIDHTHGIDMQQVWAEVKALWQGGEGYYLTPSEMDALNAHNTDFMASDPVEERLAQHLEWEAPVLSWRWEMVTTVLTECGIDRPTRADTTTAGTFIRSRNGGQSKRVKGQRLLLVPPRAAR